MHKAAGADLSVSTGEHKCEVSLFEMYLYLRSSVSNSERNFVQPAKRNVQKATKNKVDVTRLLLVR